MASLVLELLLLLDMITVVCCPGSESPHEYIRNREGELSVVDCNAMDV